MSAIGWERLGRRSKTITRTARVPAPDAFGDENQAGQADNHQIGQFDQSESLEAMNAPRKNKESGTSAHSPMRRKSTSAKLFSFSPHRPGGQKCPPPLSARKNKESGTSAHSPMRRKSTSAKLFSFSPHRPDGQKCAAPLTEATSSLFSGEQEASAANKAECGDAAHDG